MKMFVNAALLLFLSLPVTCSFSSQAPEDQDTSGDDDESSGSGLAENEPVWITEAPVMATEQTTRSPVTIASHSTSISVSQPLLTTYQMILLKDGGNYGMMDEKTTAVSPKNPSVTMEGFTPSVVEDHTEKATVREDIRHTVSKVIDNNTSVPHMETFPVQTTRQADVINPKLVADAKPPSVLMTTGGSNPSYVSEDTIKDDSAKVVNSGMDSDFEFDNEIKPRKAVPVNDSGMTGASSGHENLLERKEVLAGVIACGVVGLMFAVMLVSLMVYRMKKKDEGSYALEEHRQPNGAYQKPQRQVEFLA